MKDRIIKSSNTNANSQEFNMQTIQNKKTGKQS